MVLPCWALDPSVLLSVLLRISPTLELELSRDPLIRWFEEPVVLLSLIGPAILELFLSSMGRELSVLSLVCVFSRLRVWLFMLDLLVFCLLFRPAAGCLALLGGVLSGLIIIPMSVFARSNELVLFVLSAGCLAEFEGGVNLFGLCTLSIIDLLRLLEIDEFCSLETEFVCLSILVPMPEVRFELMRFEEFVELSAGR